MWSFDGTFAVTEQIVEQTVESPVNWDTLAL